MQIVNYIYFDYNFAPQYQYLVRCVKAAKSDSSGIYVWKNNRYQCFLQ